jgi:hypothetical protein
MSLVFFRRFTSYRMLRTFSSALIGALATATGLGAKQWIGFFFCTATQNNGRQGKRNRYLFLSLT